MIASTDLLTVQVTRIFELVDDSLHRTDGDSDNVGNVTLASVGVLGNDNEYVSMVRQQRPRRHVRFGCKPAEATALSCLCIW